MRNRQNRNQGQPGRNDFERVGRFQGPQGRGSSEWGRREGGWGERAQLSGLERQYEPNERSGPGWAADRGFYEDYPYRQRYGQHPRSSRSHDPWWGERPYSMGSYDRDRHSDSEYGERASIYGGQWDSNDAGRMGHYEGRGGFGTSSFGTGGYGGEHQRHSSDYYASEGHRGGSQGFGSHAYGAEGYGSQGYGSPGYGGGGQNFSSQGGQHYGSQGVQGGSQGYQGFGAQTYGPQNYGAQGSMNYGGSMGSRDRSGMSGSMSSFGTSSFGTNQMGGAGYGSDNMRRFRGPKGYTRSDERIKEDVCDLLGNLGEVDPSEVEVTVRNGEVTLSGSVTERRWKHTIEDAVERVSGVNDVTNNIRVTRPGATSGKEDRESDRSSMMSGIANSRTTPRKETHS